MKTHLQQAAKALLTSATEEEWYAGYAGLRKALDAELAQSVEPDAWMRHDSFKAMTDDEKAAWIESGNAEVVEEYTKPLFLHPPQPQATTPVVPEGYVLVPVEPTPAMCAEGLEDEGLTIKDGLKYAYALYTAMIKTAQGEKPQATTPAVSNDWLIRKEPNTKDKYYVAEGKPPANVLEIYEITGEKP